MPLKDLFKEWRIILYLIVVILSAIYVAYALTYKEIVVENSPISFIPNGTIVYSINGCSVNSIQDFYSCLNSSIGSIVLNTNKGEIYVPSEYVGDLYNISLTEYTLIKLGVDLGGGYNVILKPEKPLPQSELQLSVDVIESRLNAYGVKSINLYYTPEGYIIMQIPKGEESLISDVIRLGYFEAKIGNQTIFTGSDILQILTTPPYAGFMGCSPYGNQWICQYYFTLVISPQAAQNFAQVTQNLGVILQGGQAYLNETIDFYLDNVEQSSLYIAADLKGKPATQVEIQVSGTGTTESEARSNALSQAKNLEVILSSGALPAKLEIVQMSSLSPLFGSYVLNSIIYAGIITVIGIILSLFVAYRRIKVFMLLLLTFISEIIISIALGIAIGLTFDTGALLGVLVGIATGVDDQLIAVEEVLRGRKEMTIERSVRKALFIIMAAIATEFVAVVPLFVGGLGLLRGFATMTILTILVGFLITRPAVVKIAEKTI